MVAKFSDRPFLADLARIRLVGLVVDQSELHGVLHRIQDLGMRILDVHLTPLE